MAVLAPRKSWLKFCLKSGGLCADTQIGMIITETSLLMPFVEGILFVGVVILVAWKGRE